MPLVSVADTHLGELGSRFRIGTLLYFRDLAGRLLLMRRERVPNRGLWCAVGGKLEMESGESPYECACREASEEVGVDLRAGDLSLRCILSEKDYEGTGHWLMFVFEVSRPLVGLPASIEEGAFRFFELADLSDLAMPELDRSILLERILRVGKDLHLLRSDGDSATLVEESRVRGTA